MASNSIKKISSKISNGARPLLKWAGGKTQILDDIKSRMPNKYSKYIEPFFGGGALFFSIKPEISVISDSNPELINLYKMVADSVEDVIEQLRNYENTEEMFYNVRSQDWLLLSPAEAAARTIFLNHTCFNGLYRVNKQGNFNVPYGKYKNPKILDEESLRNASVLLKKATIVCDDYINVLQEYAEKDDFIFLDPPYLPISEFSDFKRYTKEQFSENDHRNLAREVLKLQDTGCNVILTNSNHPLVHELFEKFEIDIIQTKRHISCDGAKRSGEDVIIKISPETHIKDINEKPILPKQLNLYPTTRFMGSKRKLLSDIWSLASQFEFESVLDLFSGSGIVSYMFKAQNKTVISNDYMAMSATFTKALIENNSITLSETEISDLLKRNNKSDHFVEETFKDLYFLDSENILIDNIRANIKDIEDQYKRAIATSALIRACVKKRPRGVFTYTGFRYDDGRKDLLKTFNEQFIEAIHLYNAAVFNNGKRNKAESSDAMELICEIPDLVYIDPPYYSPYSDNEYVRRYHFVEGIARDWVGVEIQQNTTTKKFKSYETPFSTRNGTSEAFDHLFKKYRKSILLVSYSSNSLPTLEEMITLMSKYKDHVEVVPIDHRYSFGNQANKISDNKNFVQEYIFVGY